MENKILKYTVKNVEKVNDAVGRSISWLIILLVLTTFFVAIFRYGFNLGWVWLQELYVWIHGTVIMLGAAYTLLHDDHVRIDIFYRSLSERSKAFVNLFGTLLFLIPTILTVFWFVLPYVSLSWQRLEASREAGGMQGLFIWKTTMVIFCVLLFFQSLALISKSLIVISGKKNSKSDNST